MKTKVKVNCSECNKEYEIDKGHLSTIKKRNSRNYCSLLCKCRPIEERFWVKVDIKSSWEECWNWTAGCRTKKGYGTIKYNGKHVDSHRLSWMMFNNRFDLTPKDYICHRCDNPSCVNPSHLFLGNAQINAKDAYDKGRIKMPISEGVRFKKGDKAYNSVLTDDDVLKIREMIKDGFLIKNIALLFGVSRYKITDIRRNRSYANVK